MIGDVTAVDRLTYGALFAGYGGLELGVQSVLPGVTSWYAEVDPSAARVMAHHHPAVPNLGDVTAVDWATVEPVDVITGGSPCQDLSAAGMREGMRAGTRSGLWVSMCEAVAVIRPRLVVWENVLGALSAGADSNLEPCPGCVGDADDGPVLRALGRVLGDLASIRYDAWWASVRASDVGAPHRRTRIFLFATPADSPRQEQREPAESGVWPEPGGRAGGTAVTLLPTPKASDHTGAGVHGTGGLDLPTAVLASLPRDVADTGAWSLPREESHVRSPEAGPRKVLHDMRSEAGPEAVREAAGRPDPVHQSPDVLAELREHEDRSGRGHSPMASAEIQGRSVRGMQRYGTLARPPHRPEPSEQRPVQSDNPLPVVPSETALARGSACPYGCGASCGGHSEVPWDKYEAAIRRWEVCLGRPAPDPTEPSRNGGRRLNSRLTEFMMGLPDGWVTGHGLTRAQALKVLGNGVVPQQAAAATRLWGGRP